MKEDAEHLRSRSNIKVDDFVHVDCLFSKKMNRAQCKMHNAQSQQRPSEASRTLMKEKYKMMKKDTPDSGVILRYDDVCDENDFEPRHV